jgi:hypothetical protein
MSSHHRSAGIGSYEMPAYQLFAGVIFQKVWKIIRNTYHFSIEDSKLKEMCPGGEKHKDGC